MKPKYRHRLKIQLLTVSLFLSCLLVVVVVILSLQRSGSALRRSSAENSSLYLRQSLELTDNLVKDMARVSLIMYSDRNCQTILSRYHEMNSSEKSKAQSYLQELFNGLIVIRQDIAAVYLFDLSELIFSYDVERKSKASKILLRDTIGFMEEENAFLIDGCHLSGVLEPSFMRKDYNESAIQGKYFALSREVRGFSPNTPIGYIALWGSIERLKRLIDSRSFKGQIFLLNDAYEIIYSSNEALIGDNLSVCEPGLTSVLKNPGALQEIGRGKEKCLVSQKRSDISGWTLVSVEPLSEILSGNEKLMAQILSLVIPVIILGLAIQFGLLNRLTKPIGELYNAMATIKEGSYTSRIEIKGKNEISLLGQVFNEMSAHLFHLIYDQYETNCRLKEAELLQKDTELRYLRSQINPHFIFNTLETIRYMAIDADDEKTAAAIFKLAAFLQATLRQTHELVEIQEELANAQSYVELIQLRYKNVQVDFVIEEELRHELMPAMVLQPLIENALQHGLKEKNYSGRIELSVSRPAPERVAICVGDDGIGMKEELLAALTKRTGPVPGLRSQGIGLENVEKRFQLYYAEAYDITYERNQKGGLTVKIEFAIPS